MTSLLRIGILLAASITLAACSSLGIGLPGEEEEVTPAHPVYETFDPTGYEAEPVEDASVEHDVPAKLMAGRVEVPEATPEAAEEPEDVPAEPEAREVDGYRIQVFSSTDRGSAERVRREAAAWWEREFGESPDATIAYIRPYYRVRLGAFASEQEAEASLATVRQKYGDAFTVPDRVTIGD